MLRRFRQLAGRSVSFVYTFNMPALVDTTLRVLLNMRSANPVNTGMLAMAAGHGFFASATTAGLAKQRIPHGFAVAQMHCDVVSGCRYQHQQGK